MKAATIVAAAIFRFERAAQHHTRGGGGTRLSEQRLVCAKRNAFLGKENVMSRVSKRLIGRLVVLGLATSLSALGIALGTADVALAKGGGGGHSGGGGG